MQKKLPQTVFGIKNKGSEYFTCCDKVTNNEAQGYLFFTLMSHSGAIFLRLPSYGNIALTSPVHDGLDRQGFSWLSIFYTQLDSNKLEREQWVIMSYVNWYLSHIILKDYTPVQYSTSLMGLIYMEVYTAFTHTWNTKRKMGEQPTGPPFRPLVP